MLNLELVNRIVLILQDVAAIAECNCNGRPAGQWKEAPDSATAAGVWVGACDCTCVYGAAKKALADIKAADGPGIAAAINALTPEQIKALMAEAVEHKDERPAHERERKFESERIHALHREIGAIQRENAFLRSQRDSLHAALNRELEKRRQTEAAFNEAVELVRDHARRSNPNEKA